MIKSKKATRHQNLFRNHKKKAVVRMVSIFKLWNKFLSKINKTCHDNAAKAPMNTLYIKLLTVQIWICTYFAILGCFITVSGIAEYSEEHVCQPIGQWQNNPKGIMTFQCHIFSLLFSVLLCLREKTSKDEIVNLCISKLDSMNKKDGIFYVIMSQDDQR
jgi:hypothetical protein